jgi:transketolase
VTQLEVVTRPYARQFVAWARHREEVLCLSADLTGSCEVDDFRATYPERFLSLGMAEQNMIGVAAGLAREGFTPFVHTFGVFLTRRVYDQVAMSVAYPNLRVRLLGFLPGLTTPGGVTHQAIDDVALMRALPNMTVLDTGDATEVETLLDVVDVVPGPVYCRVLRGEVPRFFADPMRLDQVRVLSEGNDVCVISSGICTEEAMRALAAVRDVGVSVTHLHAATLKPFGDPLVLDAVQGCRAGVITMENHSIVGGLGAAVAELLAGGGVGRRLVRMGLQDTFAHGGSRPYLLDRYGLSAWHLARRVEELVGEPLGIDEHALARPEIPPSSPQTKAEAL